MSHRPTPLADELKSLVSFLINSIRIRRPLTAAELQGVARRLDELGRKCAEIERFHADVVADAYEDELLRSSEGLTGQIAAGGA